MGKLLLQLKLIFIVRLRVPVRYVRVPKETWDELRRNILVSF